MNKKTIIIPLMLTTLGIAFGVSRGLSKDSFNFFTKAEDQIYSLSFNKTTNKVSSGQTSFNAITAGGYSIKFIASGILSSSNGWMNVSPSGYIANPYDDNDIWHNDISGIKSVTVNYTGSLNIGYGWFNTNQVNDKIISGVPYTFNDEKPTHFSLTNDSVSVTEIQSIVVKYYCEKEPRRDDDSLYGDYLIKVNSFSKEDLYNGYKKALSLSSSELSGYNKIIISYKEGSFTSNETIRFNNLGHRNNNLPIILDGNGSSIYNGSFLSKGNWELTTNNIYRKNIGFRDTFSSLIINNKAAKIAETPVFKAYQYNDVDRTLMIDQETLSDLGVSSIPLSTRVMMQERWGGCIANVIGVNEGSYKTGTVFKTTHYTYDLSFDATGEYVMFDSNRNYRDVNTPYMTLSNALEYLNEDNEYFYDKDNGFLYYKAPSSLDINNADVLIPSIDTLLDTTYLTDGVTFKNFNFVGSNYSEGLVYGFMESQATVNINLSDASRHAKTLPGLIKVSSYDTSLVNCKVIGSGATGIHISSEASNVDIVSCDINDSGGCGLFIGDLGCMTISNISSNIKVNNCEVNGYGRIYRGAIGVEALYVNKLDISHNTVHDGAYSGITPGWGWCTNSPECAHREYTINHNHIYDVLRSKLYDGAPIYVLGGFNNAMGEMFNEIAYNYLEYKRGLGVIYLDESSTSYYIHDNALNVLANEDDKLLGAIFNHNPIYVSKDYYTSCNSLKIVNNYCSGLSDPKFGTHSYYDTNYDGINAYVHFDDARYARYCQSHMITVENPIKVTESHVKEDIYQAAGKDNNLNYLFNSTGAFNNSINGILSTVSLTRGSATIMASDYGIQLTHNFLTQAYDFGYRSMSFDISATKENEPVGSIIVISGGSLPWNHWYTESTCNDNETITFTIDLAPFQVEGATCDIQPRDARGIGGGEHIAGTKITISNFRGSKLPTFNTTSNSFRAAFNREIAKDTYEYKVSNMPYDWHRIIFNDLHDLYNQGYRSMKINAYGQNHNIYVFIGEPEYSHILRAGNGMTTINITDTLDPLYIMTCHEAFDMSQDDAGVYGKIENFTLVFSLSKEYSDYDFFSNSNRISRIITGFTAFNYDASSRAIVASTSGVFSVTSTLIDYCRQNGYTSFSFDVYPNSDSNIKSIVTVYRFMNGKYSYPARFDIDNGKIKVTISVSSSAWEANDSEGVNAKLSSIDFVLRDERGYSCSENQILTNGVINNFTFN